ncbi:MAG TPA: sugar porter family MFS transporter [Micromonosporaceae bacterium]|jgi:sugar porter (SP) family MFS transporter
MSTAAVALPVARRSVVPIASAAALGGFLFGYDTAIINGAGTAIQSVFHLGPTAKGFVVSSALLGSVVGAWFAGPLGDRIGRVRVMVIAAVLFLISAIGSALAVAAWDLVIWRVLGGLAVGAASVIAPAYIAEVAPAHMRGRLGSLQQLAIVTGIFLSQLAAYLLARVPGGATGTEAWGGPAWRWMFASMAIPAFMYGFVALLIPESPRFLVRKHHEDQARSILSEYVGGDTDGRIEEIKRSLGTGQEDVRLKDLRGPRFGLLPIVWVGILLSAFQQFVGINVIFYYSTALWQSVGFSSNDSFLISTITSVTNIVATIVAIALIDRIGRKPLLTIGAIGMFITLTTMAICFSDASGSGSNVHLSSVVGKVALIAANLYVFSFAVSWGPVVWVLLGEMFNNRIRASALAVAAAAQWMANWAISTTFPSIASVSLVFAYGLYAAFALLAFVFVRAGVRETKGRELEEM